MQSTNHISRVLDGTSTEVILQTFNDRTLVLITQLGKVGNLIQASIPATTPLPKAPQADPAEPTALIPPPSNAIQLTPLLGSASNEEMQTLHSLYAAQVAALVWVAQSEEYLGGQRNDVVVGIALKRIEDKGTGAEVRQRLVFNGVMSMVGEVLTGK